MPRDRTLRGEHSHRRRTTTPAFEEWPDWRFEDESGWPSTGVWATRPLQGEWDSPVEREALGLHRIDPFDIYAVEEEERTWLQEAEAERLREEARLERQARRAARKARLTLVLCFEDGNPRCQGITLQGTQCQHGGWVEGGYCEQHRHQRPQEALQHAPEVQVAPEDRWAPTSLSDGSPEPVEATSLDQAVAEWFNQDDDLTETRRGLLWLLLDEDDLTPSEAADWLGVPLAVVKADVAWRREQIAQRRMAVPPVPAEFWDG